MSGRVLQHFRFAVCPNQKQYRKILPKLNYNSESSHPIFPMTIYPCPFRARFANNCLIIAFRNSHVQ